MKQMTWTVLALAGAMAVLAGFAYSRGPAHDPAEGFVLDDEVMRVLEDQIPYDFHLAENPGPHCDLLDVELVVVVGENGEDSGCRWRVMDGDTVQWDCRNFADLYHACDAPPCYRMHVVKVKRATGEVMSVSDGTMCLE